MFDEGLAHFDSLFEILLNELMVKMYFSQFLDRIRFDLAFLMTSVHQSFISKLFFEIVHFCLEEVKIGEHQVVVHVG